MHHPNGCGVTPAYKDGILYAPMGDTLYAFDALMKGGDDGVKDAPKGGDRHDILWMSTLAAKRCGSAPTFVDDAVVLNTSEGLEFYPTKVRDFTKVERTKIVKTGGSGSGGVAHNGRILVAASTKGHVAIDLKTDRELWRVESGDGSSPVIDGDAAVFADSRGALWCVGLADGRIRWKEDGYGTMPASPSVAKGVVYMATNIPGTMNALDGKTGTRLWTWTVPDKTTAVSSEQYGNAVYAPPLVADGRVYFTSYSGFLYCLHADPKAKERLAWKEKISDRVCMTVPTAYEGAVYVRGAGATCKFGVR